MSIPAFLLGIALPMVFVRAVSDQVGATPQETQVLHSLGVPPLRIVPEYRRRLERVVVSVADGDTPLEYHDQILSHLPDYTEIYMLAPQGRLKKTDDWIRHRPYWKRVRSVAYDPRHGTVKRLYRLLPEVDGLVPVDASDHRVGSQYGSLWAQDLFEAAVTLNHRTILLAACTHKSFAAAGDRQDLAVVSDNIFLDRLSCDEIEVRRLPLAFKGGNILVDEFMGRWVAFCGCDVVRTTRTAWRALQSEELSDATIAAMFETALNVDQIVVVGGNRPQPSRMYHLDQAMLLLHDRVVAVPRVVGPRPPLEPDASNLKHVEGFLGELRSILSGLGYTPVDLDTTVQNVLHYQHYVNAIPYIDKQTGKRMLLMPVFQAAQTDQDQELIRKNTQTLESLGYTVVHVPTKADEMNGGIHCLVNVLQ